MKYHDICRDLGMKPNQKTFYFLKECFARCLSKKQQFVISLYYGENKSLVSIAKADNLNKSTVSRHRKNALEIFKRASYYYLTK